MQILLDCKLVYSNGTGITIENCKPGYIPGSPTIMQLQSALGSVLASIPMDGTVIAIFDNARGTTSQMADNGALPVLLDGSDDPISAEDFDDAE